MRTDLRLQGTSAGKAEGNREALQALARRTIDERAAGASLSGNERNHLFVSGGGSFADISGISGLDDPADGRAFAFLDYDRDGWLDIALVNANDPLFELYRNRIACRPGQSERGRVIALRLIGGNDTPGPSAEWSNRDAIGATVAVALGTRRIVRELRAGEGLAAQNSATMLIGIGARDVAPSVSVTWPSGKVSAASDVAAGRLLTMYEIPMQAPNSSGVTVEPYLKRSATAATEAVASDDGPPLPVRAAPADDVALRFYTTMATWCLACRTELPTLRRLRATFGPDQLAMFGVPVDPKEGAEQVSAWAETNEPPYRLLIDTSPSEMRAVGDLVVEQLGMEAVPASFVTDSRGRVLLAQWGPPSISKIRSLLRAVEARGAPLDRCASP